MPVAKLKNVTLSYHEYGDKHLPTVVLIMGLGMSEHSWPKELLRLLVKKGLRVITFDNRDVG
ncbi:alpha/beta fold hydrolase, partial [Turicimonas muris]